MHHGADSHRALTTAQYLKDVNVDVMKRPARSPDLNPIENIWSQQTRAVYRNRTQYDTVGELKLAIKEALKSITVDYRKILALSAWSRAIAVIEQQGRNIAINSVKDILGGCYILCRRS